MEALLPEWMPNIHPLIIHFPIALCAVALLFDVAFVIEKSTWMRNGTMSLYTLAAVSAFAAYLSGDQAIDMVSIPFKGEVTASQHSDWGHYTLYFFAGYAFLRGFLYWKRLDTRKFVAISLLILGLVGMGLVAKTADLGGELVYKYGVGTKN